jgi:hypothetical protein
MQGRPNEALFREVNEQIGVLNSDLGTDNGTERVVERAGGMTSSRREGDAAELARKMDPRS